MLFTSSTSVRSGFLCLALSLLTNLAAPAGTSESGVLVMAHGGTEEWNAAIQEAVAPVREYCPTVIAFGMADPETLQKSVQKLESRGVTRIVVARLFISGASFREQTEYFLGLRSDPPEYFLLHHSPGHMSSGHVTDRPRPHDMLYPSKSHPMDPIQTASSFALTHNGLYDSPQIGKIVAERVRDLSRRPESESVLVLAHGVGDDRLNSHWVDRIEQISGEIRRIGTFQDIRVETLREDWRDKRKIAEQRVRDFVVQGGSVGKVLVVPFRVYGFGPYESVLKGLNYRADGRALLPHPLVTEWLMQEASRCFRDQGWHNPFQKTNPLSDDSAAAAQQRF